MISLTRKQITELDVIMKEHPDVSEVRITISLSCPIGTNIYATIKELGYRESTFDITDYENW